VRECSSFAERQRSATRVLGAGRAQARNVTSIRVGCSAWLAASDIGMTEMQRRSACEGTSKIGERIIIINQPQRPSGKRQ